MKTAAEVCFAIQKIEKEKKDRDLNKIIEALIIGKGELKLYDFENDYTSPEFQWALNEKDRLEELGFKLAYGTYVQTKFKEVSEETIIPAKKFLGFTIIQENKTIRLVKTPYQVEIKTLIISACCKGK